MGELAAARAREFQERCPADWTCAREVPILDEHLACRYGFQPRADVVFTGARGRRIVVELEISRADPVANQVKFLIARNAGALRPDDVLVSMFSSHIARGRRNISAAFARHLRTEGTAAFQLSLLPDVLPGSIKAANDDAATSRRTAHAAARREIDRIWSIHEALGEREHRIHFAGDVADVVANVWAWNDEIVGPSAESWGERTIQFFVYDPVSRLFAPSKFCAFVPVARPAGPAAPPTMTLAVYASLGEQDPRFDGNRARRHLANRLAFELISLDQGAPAELRAAFEDWRRMHARRITIRGVPGVLQPPKWYLGG